MVGTQFTSKTQAIVYTSFFAALSIWMSYLTYDDFTNTGERDYTCLCATSAVIGLTGLAIDNTIDYFTTEE